MGEEEFDDLFVESTGAVEPDVDVNVKSPIDPKLTRRRLEDRLEELRLKKLAQDFDLDGI